MRPSVLCKLQIYGSLWNYQCLSDPLAHRIAQCKQPLHNIHEPDGQPPTQIYPQHFEAVSNHLEGVTLSKAICGGAGRQGEGSEAELTVERLGVSLAQLQQHAGDQQR